MLTLEETTEDETGLPHRLPPLERRPCLTPLETKDEMNRFTDLEKEEIKRDRSTDLKR